MNLAYVRILNQKEKRKAIYFFIETIDFIEMMLQSLWFLQCTIFVLFYIFLYVESRLLGNWLVTE